jgi:ketosteroid isomerase-like protein
MSQENVEAVRRGYETWSEDGIDAALANFIDENVEMHDIVEMPGGSVYRGHEGARAMWSRWSEVFDEMSFGLEQATDLDDEHVLPQVRAVGRMQGSDAPVEVTFYEVWTVRDGRGIKRVASANRTTALEAAGLPE